MVLVGVEKSEFSVNQRDRQRRVAGAGRRALPGAGVLEASGAGLSEVGGATHIFCRGFSTLKPAILICIVAPRKVSFRAKFGG